MYKIIGADQKEYGPISLEQMHEWIGQGRLNAQSPVQKEGETSWKPLSSFPEFANVVPKNIPPAPAVLPSAMPGGPMLGAPDARVHALNSVSGPAISLMIAAGLGIAMGMLNLVFHTIGASFSSFGSSSGQNPEAERLAQMMSGTAGIITSIIGIVLWVFVLFGATKMKKLESFGLCMAASIAAMMPCMCPCCLIGIGVGIWSLTVLNKPEVKSQFT